MKKLILTIAVFILLAMILIPTRADIPTNGLTWLGYTFKGTDPYYDQSTTVYAYRTGTMAVLAVAVNNASSIKWASNVINVTHIGITFDWGQTFNSTQVSATKPIPVSGATRVFFVNFTVPDTATASNQYLHYYTVTVNYQTHNRSNTFQNLPGSYNSSAQDFVVYSGDQADAMNLKSTYNSYPPLSGFPSINGFSNMSAQAQILLNQAKNESSTADMYYRQGNFAAAKQSYSNAVNYRNLALSAEQSWLTTIQNLQIQQTQADIGLANATTSFFNGLSTMWVLFGIGWVLLGIGYIVKWLRKRPEPQPATT
jgi:hypothetical protein